MMSRFLSRLSSAIHSGIFSAYLVVVLAAACAALVAVAAVNFLTPLASADRFVRDLVIARFLPAQAQDPDIVVVAITEETLQNFQYRAPVDREYLSKLLTALAAKKPRAIGLDILLDQPTEETKDTALRQTLRTINVPLIVAYTDLNSVIDEKQRAYLDDFVPANKRGFVNLGKDQGDTVRWIFPGKEAGGKYIFSFSRALAEKAGAQTSSEVVEMVWRGKPDDKPYAFAEYPALSPPEAIALLPDAWLQNKIVLVGSDVTLTDRHRTPFANLDDSGKGMLPGIMIQAHAISQLINGTRSPAMGWAWDCAFAFLLALISAGLGARKTNLLLRTCAGIAAIAIFWIASILVYQNAGPMIALIAPTLAAVMAFSAVDSLAGGEARRQREFIKGAFSRYISPALVEQLVRDPGRMSLQGERRIMTFIFTDVKDFTAMSEKLESKELSRILNAYLDGMASVILKQDGMIDKFIGDAVFAIFNAPVDQADHAERALRCALEMDVFACQFKAEQAAAGVSFGITRIGVHTGQAVIGNFGSSARFTYTASGDAVNTAARLESLNKYFGTRLLVSGATAAQCSSIAFRPVASVVLMGKTEAVEVFEPLNGEYSADYIERYTVAYAALQQHSEKALALFEALHAEMPGDPCVAVHQKRLQEGGHGTVIIMNEK